MLLLFVFMMRFHRRGRLSADDRSAQAAGKKMTTTAEVAAAAGRAVERLAKHFLDFETTIIDNCMQHYFSACGERIAHTSE